MSLVEIFKKRKNKTWTWSRCSGCLQRPGPLVLQSTQNALSTCTKMAPLLSGKNLEREQNERIFEGTLGVVKKVLGRPWRSHGSSLSKESGGWSSDVVVFEVAANASGGVAKLHHHHHHHWCVQYAGGQVGSENSRPMSALRLCTFSRQLGASRCFRYTRGKWVVNLCCKEYTQFSALCRSSIVCEIHSLRLFDCAIGRRGLLAACPAFEKYPQLIDVSGAGALSPASRLVIIGFGTG